MCQWGMLMVLTRLGSPAMVGRFGLALAITAPVYGFASLSLRTIQETDATQEYPFAYYITTRFLTCLLAFAATAIVSIVSGYSMQVTAIIILISIVKFLEALCDCYHGLFGQRELLRFVSWSLMSRGVLALVALAAIVYYFKSLALACAFMVLVYFAVLVLFDMQRGKEVVREYPSPGINGSNGKPIDWKVIWKIIVLSTPLGLVVLLSSLNTNIPRYFLEHLQGEQALGFFLSMAYFHVVGTIAIRAIGQSSNYRLANSLATNRLDLFWKQMGLQFIAWVVISAIIMGGVVLWGHAILNIMYGQAYAQYSGVFKWLMLGSTFHYLAMFVGYGLTAARITKLQVLPLIVGILATGATSYIWVAPYGLYGAAYSLLAGNIVWLVGSALLMAKIRVPESCLNKV